MREEKRKKEIATGHVSIWYHESERFVADNPICDKHKNSTLWQTHGNGDLQKTTYKTRDKEAKIGEKVYSVEDKIDLLGGQFDCLEEMLTIQ